MHAGHLSAEKACATRDSTVLDNCYKNKTIPALDKAMELTRDKNQKRDIVLQLYLYRQHGFFYTEFENQTFLDARTSAYMVERSHRFRREQYALVEDLLIRMGVKGEFNVIHWRAELDTMDYKKCVEQLIQSKELLAGNTTTITTILMPSLSTDDDKSWMAKNQKAQEKNESLATLKNAGFLKLDSVTSKSKDLFHLATWDLILAQKAPRFATCTKKCADDSVCTACNHRGSFAETAISYRSQAKKNSEQCWPE